jgi:Ca2+-binding EF-hand superfamily protein
VKYPLQEERVFAATDTDGSGTVSFEEFCALPSNKQLKKEKLRAVFDALDVNRDGVLSLEEFSVWERQVGSR